MVVIMKYTLTKINENETIMNITDGAIMITEAKKVAKKVAKKNEIIVLRICQNGVYLMEYFNNLNRFSIAEKIR